jgi:sterol desaturase/sphingolipid hydroxylase (fatty acid hydroxylase superfamily)
MAVGDAGPSLAGLFVALLVLSCVFWVIERAAPGLRGQHRAKGETALDVGYWFFTSLVTRVVTRVALGVAFILIAWSQGVSLADLQQSAGARRTWATSLPLLVQVPLILLLADVLAYWTHRLFHGRRLWPFHAVHHSSTAVDWLSSVRLHPVNDAVARVVQVLPLYWMGFDGRALAAFVPFLTFYALVLHANVNWSYGPLRRAIASPMFHRWHHTTEAEGLDKNFAGLFPFIDIVFGTYYMPAGRRPERFGVIGAPLPSSLIGQLLYPFRRQSKPPAPDSSII